jgi:hypothetical protein
VVLDTTAPALAVMATANETKVPVVTLTGTVSDTGTGISKVTVNGNPVAIGADGKFSVNVGLMEGTNNITVSAYDFAGNVKTVTLSVKYTYMPELNDLNNKIDSTKSDLSNQINSMGMNAMLLAVLALLIAILAIVLTFARKPKSPASEVPKEENAVEQSEHAEETPAETTPKNPKKTQHT